MNIYELTGVYLHLQALLEDPETDAQAVKDTLEAMEGELEEKADNYARIMRNLEGKVTAIKAEETRLKKNREALENSISNLKERLQTAMITTGKTKFKTDLFSFAIQKNGGALPVIVDVDTSKLPDDLVKIKEEPDLKAIGELLKTKPEEAAKYAHYGERGESLRIK